MKAVENISTPPEPSLLPARKIRRESRHRGKIKSGHISLVKQLGIIVAVAGIAALALLVLLKFIAQPGEPTPVDQAILNAADQ